MTWGTRIIDGQPGADEVRSEVDMLKEELARTNTQLSPNSLNALLGILFVAYKSMSEMVKKNPRLKEKDLFDQYKRGHLEEFLKNNGRFPEDKAFSLASQVIQQLASDVISASQSHERQ